MSESAAILITLVLYKLLLIGIGVYTSRRTKSAEDFFLGGRGLGPWVASLSASASSSSAWTLLGVSGFAYAKGLSACWIIPACVGGFAINWYVLAPRLRRLSESTGALTVTDILAGPRDAPGARWVARVASAIVLVSLVTYVAAQFQGAGKTFHEVFGLGSASSVLIGAGVIVFYTLLGGFWAVSVTDTIQGMVMAVAAVALPLGGLALVGGFTGLSAGIATVDAAAPGFASLTGGAAPAVAVGMIVGLLGIGLGYPGQPHVVNRFMALRDDAAARRGRTIAMSWALVTYAGMVVVGLCARALPELAAVADREVAFYGLVSAAFPPVVAGVMVAAVLSATMSTADSQLLVAASSASHDLRAGGDARDHGLGRTRIVVVGLSAIAVLVALYGNQEIFSHVLFAWTAMGAAFGPVLMVRVLLGPVGPTWTIASMAAGFGLAVLAYSTPATSGTAWERVAPVLVAVAIALAPALRRRGRRAS